MLFLPRPRSCQRLPPGVLSVFFDPVSATNPILPRATDNRAPGRAEYRARPGRRPVSAGATRIRERRPPRHHRTPPAVTGNATRPGRTPARSRGKPSARPATRPRPRAKPGPARHDHHRRRRRGGPPSRTDRRLGRTGVSDGPPSRTESSERLRRGGSRRQRASRSQPPADRRPPAALTHQPTSVPNPDPGHRPTPTAGRPQPPSGLERRPSPRPPPISAVGRPQPPRAPSATFTQPAAPPPQPVTRRPAPGPRPPAPAVSGHRSCLVRRRSRVRGSENAASRPSSPCTRMGSSHGQQAAEE